MRIILVFLIGIVAGFAARPWLISNVAPNLPPQATSWFNSFLFGEESAEPKTFGFIGYLTEEGFHGPLGDLPVGEGPDQLFRIAEELVEQFHHELVVTVGNFFQGAISRRVDRRPV